MHQADKYYKHSGAIGPLGPIFMIALGAIGALVLGAIYGYAIAYIPFIYLNFFITLGFGFGVGLLIGMGGKIGKVRNGKILLLFGLLGGVAAEYVGWVIWIFASFKQETLAISPSYLVAVIQLLAAEGAWEIFGWTPKGMAIYAIWAIEATMIVGMSTMVALGVLSSTPFCERCSKWTEKEEAIASLEAIENPDELKSQLEQGDFTSLMALKGMDAESNLYTQLDLQHCPSCQQNHFLTIKAVTVTIDSDNDESKSEEDIVEHLMISPEQYGMIKEHLVETAKRADEVDVQASEGESESEEDEPSACAVCASALGKGDEFYEVDTPDGTVEVCLQCYEKASEGS